MSKSPHVARGIHEDSESTLKREVPDAILLPYQQKWVADSTQVKICEKGRRIGISWAEAADAALYAASENGGNVYYLAYNQDMTKGFIQDAAWWTNFYDRAAGKIREKEIVYKDDDGEKAVKVFEIQFASGNMIQALPSTARNLRSKGAPGDRAVLDEFAFVDAPDELLKAAIAFLVWGGGVHIISTHDGESNPFNELVEQARSGRKPYSVHRTTFMDAVDQGLYKRICLVTGKDWTPAAEEQWVKDIYDFYGDDATEELDVEPAEAKGRYLSRLVVRRCMDDDIPVKRLALESDFATRPQHERRARVKEWCDYELLPHLQAADENLKGYFGQDFARHGDLSALIPAQQGEDLVLRSLFCAELSNVPYEQQKQIVFYILDRLPRLTHAAFDATGNGGYLAEVAMQRYGSTAVTEQKMNNPWYLEWMPKYRAKLEDRQIVLPGHVDILDDHSDVVRHRGIPKVPQGKTRKGSDGVNRHGDTAIAGCLLSYAGEQEGAPIDVQHDGRRFAGEAYGDDESVTRRIDENAGFGAVTSTINFSGYQ